jgi:hypothetical protein
VLDLVLKNTVLDPLSDCKLLSLPTGATVVGNSDMKLAAR